MADNQPITSDENSFNLEPPPLSQEEEREAKQLARRKAWLDANKEELAVYHKAYREANKERMKTRDAAYHKANKERRNARDRASYAATRERRKAYLAANKEKIRVREKAYNEANKERRNALSKAYRDANPGAARARDKAAWLKSKYLLSLEAFNAMRAAQNERCACCRAPFGLVREMRPCVDHCHASGKVRGLVCRLCNLTIGHAGDNPKVLRQCARYLERMAEAKEFESVLS